MTNQPKCAACKRRLKHPTASGLGPVCERRLTGPPPARTRIPGPTAEPVPGQAELPLADQLAIWSPA